MPTKFDFVSPGIQLREIDQSVLEPVPEQDGILLIGRARSGPAMRPVKVTNLNDFVEIFGTPMDGVRQSDPWRQGNTGAPNYAAYAAQAYLAAGVGPVKYLRLLGKQTSGEGNEAGWSMGSKVSTTVGANAAAYGLIVMPSSSAGNTAATLDNAVSSSTTANADTFTINVPADAGGDVTGGAGVITIEISSGGAFSGVTGASNKIMISGSAATATEIMTNIISAINNDTAAEGTSGTWIKATGGRGQSGVPGVDAANGTSGAEHLKLTATNAGTTGNDIVVTNGTGTMMSSSPQSLAGGTSDIKPAHLAAVFYCSGSAIGLNGEAADDLSALTKRAGSLIKSNNPNWGFDIYVSGTATQTVTHSVNFDPSSPNYIRSVLNTDPTMFYGTSNYADNVTDNIPYFLGETFETNVSFMSAGATTGEAYAAIVSLSGALGQADDHRQQLTAARTGWFISPQPSQKKLFYLTALSEGSEIQNNHYVSISDIKLATSLSPRASFTLNIMKRGGARDQVVESFSGLTLDSNDDDYIVKRIGDVNETWDTTSKKFSITGAYPNRSSYVRVTMNSAIQIDSSDVPMGFVGPKVPATVAEIHKNTVISSSGWIGGNNTIPLALATASKLIENVPVNFSMSIAWPTLQLTTKDTKMSANYDSTDLFGIRQNRKAKNNHQADFADLVHRRVMQDPHLEAGDALSTASFVFTLDDIMSGSTVTTKYYFKEGSYSGATNEKSISKNVGLTGTTGLIDGLRIRQFAAPLFGGADGIDVRYADPFSNQRIDQGANRYPEFTVNTALDMIEDRDNMRYELVSMPGVVDATLNRKLMNMSADRGDNLAIVDLSGIYRPGYDREDVQLAASISTMTTYLDTQQIDNSYAAAYYPNIRIRDTLNGNDTVLVVPPSVAAIGAIAKSEAVSQPWFAPAGFNRGGLSRLGGPQGPVCVGTVEHLTKADRDILYAAHINPIARFPATGDTVIFGQRTLQQAASALDRINVRRLMIFLKKHIGAIADTILFDQNVEATWNRFKARADAVLSEVKTELGITEYKLVLDKSTTTPDLIDRNIMYAKIFIKPARAIEFIAIDFIITKTGVEFE